MNLYPEMNKKIVGILKTGEGHCLYAAARIEELESQLKTAQEALWKIRTSGKNEDSTAQWMQKWAAWGLEPAKWEKPSDKPPIQENK